MKKNQINLLIILFCIVVIHTSYGQSKWEKILDKADDDYEIGNYEDARSTVDKLKKESIKSYGANSNYFAMAMALEAKYDVALGILKNVQASLDSAIQMSEGVSGVGSLEHAFILKDASQVMILYGDFQQAGAYLEDSYKVIKEQGGLNEDIQASFDVMKAEILVGKGFNKDALTLINGSLEYYRGRTLDVDDLKKKQIRERLRDYARMMMFKGNAFRKMGNYLSADSAFVFANEWILDNLKKSDILYSANQFYNTLLLEQNGMEVGAVVDKYEQAYLHTVRKYAPSHYITIMIQERLIKSYMKNDNKVKLRNMETEFRKTIKKDYGTKSINGIILETLDYDVLSGGRDRGLENKVMKFLATDNVIPKYHSKRIDLLEFANKVALINGRNENSYNYLQQILEIKKELYGEDSPEYSLTKVKMANYLVDYTDDFDQAAEIYQKNFREILEKEITPGHVDYVEILDHLALFYEENDEYAKANEILNISLETARRKYDNLDIAYAVELDKIANLQLEIGEYAKAEANILEAITILKSRKDEFSEAYFAQALITEATLLALKGEYDAAENDIIYSEKIQARGIKTVESAAIDTGDELAEVYLDIGRYRDAETILVGILKKRRRQFGENNRHLTEPLVLSSRHKMIVGEYSEAEKLARDAYNIGVTTFGENSTKVTPAAMQLAKVYTTLGDYVKAETLLENVIEIRTKQFGEQHVDVARAISELALVKYYKDDDVYEIEDLFLKAEKIIGKNLGGSNPYYAEILKNLAIVYIAEKKYADANRMLNTSGRIWEKRIGKRNNINAATINILKGDILYAQKKYDEADDFYHNARKLYEGFFSDQHPEYVKVLSKLSKTYFMQGNPKKAQDALEEVLGNYNNFIKDYFPALSEREKAKFWNTIKQDYEFYNTLVINYSKNTDLIGSLYNNALLTKALLLNSSIKIRQQIQSSGDEGLIQLYSDWEAKKELLTRAIAMSASQLAEAGIDPNSVQKEVETLEKQLSEKSSGFSSEFDNQPVTWEKVKNALKPGEIALEMVRFRVFNHHFTDSVMYAVMYVKNDNSKSKPGLILLKNGEELEKKYLKYYRNIMKFKLPDERSYENFWKPIELVIGEPSTIYLSADGVYNQINIESIELADGSFLLDKSNIVLVSNTKDLYTNKVRSNIVQDANVAMMFGDPIFYVSSDPGQWAGEASQHRGGNPDVIGRLPGTEEEIKNLKALLRESGWVTEDYTNTDATEEKVKNIDNPKIFHIATHGFFQPNAELNSEDIGLKENLVAENPLLKTGLLLVGAGDILNQTTSNFNLDDGILTAYEAMNMKLDKTELVVLSACETGLGEIEAGEGVYGLQRAFLVAGAKTIIMSLFKVSDEATQKLMIQFYKNWLQTGNKRQSFIDAKKTIREEFVDPIYWGPFIMIGLN
ncbi:CHAT domain-containing tetratricopeptide repeat protein [Reichenbachiella sp. MALMAid0571]|uniref:CHAT domain-containing protein n=1 Tax=Reichenbachiella sp. MALMAid0571 TaxID=3143939 RepID=UPI0032DF5DBE